MLLSGGASSLMAVPADGLTLEDKRRTTATLLRAGADIHALNTVRKHLSAVKGGQLAAATRAACTVLVISDVVGDDLSVIASGPTVADGSRFADALDVLRRFGGTDQFPPRGRAHDSSMVRTGASRRRRSRATRGWPALTRRSSDRGETPWTARSPRPRLGDTASSVSTIPWLARRVWRRHRTCGPCLRWRAISSGLFCVVSSGETTVHVTGSGKGGRNQEFVLAAAELLDQLEVPGSLASVGTDGVDGPTDAAGAYADSSTINRALAEGRPPDRYLSNNDSLRVFRGAGRSHPHGSDRHERRRPSTLSVSLSFQCFHVIKFSR